MAGIASPISIYFVLQQQVWFAIILFLTGTFIITSKYVTSLNLKQRVIWDYFTFWAIKSTGEKIRYSKLIKIVITKQKKGYTANSRSRERQVKWSQFDAHLIYDDQKSFKILSKNSKRELLKRLENLIIFLGLQVEDQTAHAPFDLKVD